MHIRNLLLVVNLFLVISLIACKSTAIDSNGENFTGIIVAKDEKKILVTEYPIKSTTPGAIEIEYDGIDVVGEEGTVIGFQSLEIGQEIRTSIVDVKKEYPGHAKVQNIVVQNEKQAANQITRQAAIKAALLKVQSKDALYIQSIELTNNQYLITLNKLFGSKTPMVVKVDTATGKAE